jgi:hypothetical protein
MQAQFTEVKEAIKSISGLAYNSSLKDRVIDSINNKLKVIYAQYGSELSKELAMIVIENIYFNYAQLISNEVYELQKKGFSYQKIMASIKNHISIINDDKMQELDGFVYRDKHLITYTTGQIIEPEKIISIIEGYSEKNGMLRKEIENLLSIEANVVIKRL